MPSLQGSAQREAGLGMSKGALQCSSKRPELGWHLSLSLQRAFGQEGAWDTAGRGQASLVPGPALTPGLHLELCSVINLLCQIPCTPCQPDYCGDCHGPGNRTQCAQEGGKPGQGMQLISPTGGQPLWLWAWPKSRKPGPANPKKQCFLAGSVLSNPLTKSDPGTRHFSSSG